MKKDIAELYGKKIRIRVCGLCWRNNQLLMVRHQIADKKDFWAPPGGGLEFGQSSENSLKREFQEETGLLINVNEFRFAAEFIQPPLHAVELFFAVQMTGGDLKMGKDPELPEDKQIIHQVDFLDWSAIAAIPDAEKHGILRYCSDEKDLKSLNGFYSI